MKIGVLGIIGLLVLSGCAGNDDAACNILKARWDSNRVESREFYDSHGGWFMTKADRDEHQLFNTELLTIQAEMDLLKNCTWE